MVESNYSHEFPVGIYRLLWGHSEWMEQRISFRNVKFPKTNSLQTEELGVLLDIQFTFSGLAFVAYGEWVVMRVQEMLSVLYLVLAQL